MPDHDDVVAFTDAVGEHLPDHNVHKESADSRVAMLAREEDTWVDELAPDSDFWDQGTTAWQ